MFFQSFFGDIAELISEHMWDPRRKLHCQIYYKKVLKDVIRVSVLWEIRQLAARKHLF